jgi:spermidine/putrescine transport system substrate-binding protein
MTLNDMTTRLTRRQVLQRGAAGVTILSLPGLLAACGGGGGSSSSGKPNDVLKFSNWPLYIDVDEKSKAHPTLDQFTKQTGIKVDYFEDINDNATYFAKIQGPLSQGRSIDRDIIVMTDSSRFPALLIEKGWVEKLDKNLIPNFSNLIPAQASPPFDPKREYSLPWQSGMTGIAWNSEVTGPVTSIGQLLDDPKLKGKVTMLSEFSDSVGLTMLANGDDPSNVTDASMKSALDRIKKATDSGQIRQFTGNDYAQPLTKGDIAAAVAWSGDIVQLLADNPKLRWALPSDGGMIWTDNMLIPKGGSASTASTYMNFVYEPKTAAQIAAYVNYVTPVAGAKEALAKTDPATANNPLIFPTEKMLSQVHQFDSKALQNDTYQADWQKVLGA